MTETRRPIKVTKKSETESKAEIDRRLEIRFLKHLKTKYPEDDKRLTKEMAQELR